MIRTKEDYIQSLKEQGNLIYAGGKKVEDVTTHPAFIPHINCAAMTYEMANKPEFEDLATATSHLTGERINRFTHIHQSVEDLIKKPQLLRAIAHETGSCFQRCVGWDALNATYMTTYDIDQKHGTEYHQRFIEYLKMIQSTSKMVVGGMTDTKGDRALPPHKQPDPDVFTHVTEKRKDGIVIRGNKAHQTGAANSHEILIMPTQFMREEDADFSLACAVPLNSPGVTQIFGRQTNDERRNVSLMDAGNEEFGSVGGEMPLGVRRRFRALGAGLHVRRMGVQRHFGGALRHLAPPELRRLQRRGLGCDHRGGCHRGGDAGQRQGQPHKGKAG